MQWISLKLWAEEEEKRIHSCISIALQELISLGIVQKSDNEVVITGRLRKLLYGVKKREGLVAIITAEASTFETSDSPKPSGHPDIRFSFNTTKFEQYNYDVECKLVRIKREGKNHNYCKYYVSDGVCRFNNGTYAKSVPPMGAIIGYLQEGEPMSLLRKINTQNEDHGLNVIIDKSIKAQSVSYLVQDIDRSKHQFILHHFWADFR